MDVVLWVALSHHLTDCQLEGALAEAGRVARHRLIFLDALQSPSSPVSRLLWGIDRGSHPRPAEILIAAIERHFHLEQIMRYKVYHRYLLCVARSRWNNPTGQTNGMGEGA